MNSSTPPEAPSLNTVSTITVPVKVVDEASVQAPEDYSTRQPPLSSEFDGWTYDPDAIATHYSRRPFQVFGRLLAILWPVMTFALGLWLDQVTQQVVAHQRRRAIQLRTILTRLGPAYIKIGQALSTRPDLVPPIYLEELTKLQDQLPPFPNAIAFRFIEEELGAPPNEIYAELSEEPVAAASLGQVYKGRLKTGEQVAVKVQRPGLAQRITLDLYILRQLALWVTKVVSRIRSDLVGIMDEFGARIFEEMDYTHEGENAERFAQLYGHLKNIYVPHIYKRYTARRVLTMEWIEGIKLTKIEELRGQGIEPTTLIETGVQCSLRQLLEHGFFHADPHPGNLLAMRDGRLAYLDFGMMSEVKPYQRYGLIEAVVHMVNRDFEGLAQDYIKLEFLTPDTDLTPIIPALADVFNNALGASVAELNFKSITDEFSALMYEYPFRVPAYYALIIRSLVTLEGIAINVDPNFKVLSKAYPYVAKRLLTDPAPELRTSLQDLLFKDGQFRWNRLENLLKNARGSEDYDLNLVLNQTVDFLFSERGDFLRDRIADQVVVELDALGRNLLQTISQTINDVVQSQFQPSSATYEATPNGTAAPSPANPESSHWDAIVRIVSILRQTQGFNPATLATVVPQLLLKPETHEMGQRIVGGLTQRLVARIIREVLLGNQPEEAGSIPQPTPAMPSLPSG